MNKKRTKSLADLEQHDDQLAIEFSNEVLALMERDGLNSLEAIVELCSEHDIAEEDVVDLITPKLLAIIQSQSEDLNLLKNKTKTGRII